MTEALFEAIETHSVSNLAMLLRQGADPNGTAPDYTCWTPLKSAVEEMAEGGSLAAVVLLIRAGADVDGGRVPGNTTPLIIAAMHSLPNAVAVLLAAGADPNTRDDEGATPLGRAERNGDTVTKEILTACGAIETNR